MRKNWNFWESLLLVIALFCFLICANVIANLIFPPIY